MNPVIMAQEFCPLATRTIHTAHIGLSKLLYSFHPLFGKEIEVLGAAGGERDMVRVRLPNNTTRGIPAWMFDEAICACVRSAEKPIIACQALLKLAQLLDSLKPVARSAAHEDTTTSSPNPRCPPGSKPASVDVGTNADQRIDSQRVPDPLPAALAAVAHGSRPQRKTRKRRLP